MYKNFFLLYAGLVRLGHAAYSVQDNYDVSNWANMFNFDTFDDPTRGYVNYVDELTARSTGLFKTDNNVVTMASDWTSNASGRGRNSVRLTSKNQYTRGLFVVDLAHMPGNACGIWGAFWTTGPNWPNSGEIDIIEGVNLQVGNKATMHTSNGCSFNGKTCLGNEGCGELSGGTDAFGDTFNANNGGIYATEWTSGHISHWFFGRGTEPEDVLGDAPDPSRWGPPTSTFVGGNGCDIDSHFMNHQIVFDITFCGDWAGSVFQQDSKCAAFGSTCSDYVKNNPGAFTEAYWAVNALKVYSDNGSGPAMLTTRDNIPASTPALSVVSPVVTVINASLPTPFSDIKSLEPISSWPTSLPENNTVVAATEQPTGTEEAPPFLGGSPTPMTLYVTEGFVPETVPTAAVAYYSSPFANADGQYSPDGSHYGAPKMMRAHRAARHLKNHRSGIRG